MAGTQVMRKVKVEGGYLNFSSAHFITYSGQCERLHGHNYSVLVEVEGELGSDGLIFDFTILKKRTKEICRQLDHRFLLPLRNPHLELTRSSDSWEVQFREKRYVFPLSDVVELPIENSTAELLAQYICEKLCQVLEEYPAAGLRSIMVGVEEAPTQMGFYRQELHL